ncbi:non-classical arabinogalactan protein 30 [Heracleum sosnowskyi]|uniref:Non-classical arabinogalactan protein 30 n=1 Tax=Heracleum sosnowskyi TaxID=360622 RepID=A0AAD8HEU5_9APIA|nr:non-classical arabinogalactan protein 30 [Heracleum sosnowskyi]
MARMIQLAFLATLLVSVAFSFVSASNEILNESSKMKVVNVIVEGMVYCQSCNKLGSWSLTGAQPISGAKLSVICESYKNRVSYHKTFQTDTQGYFYAELVGYKMTHMLLDHPLQSCIVKLVSSPSESCNVLTNVNYGINGATLHYENKRLAYENKYEALIYAAGPLAFRPAQCT